MCGYYCTGFIDFMFVGKTLIDCTSSFSPYHFEENDNIILNILKMSECNSIKSVNVSRMSNQAKFKLNEINKIKDYLNSEIQ